MRRIVLPAVRVCLLPPDHANSAMLTVGIWFSSAKTPAHERGASWILQTPYFSRTSGRLGAFVVVDNRTSQLAQMSQKMGCLDLG